MRRALTIAAVLVLLLVTAAVGYLVFKEESPMKTDGPSIAIAEAELQAAASTRVLFGHQSVGGNIIGGIPAVYARHSVSAPQIVESAEPLTEKSYIQHAQVGQNTDPQSKLDDFERILASGVGEQVDVAFMKFCYVDITAATDVPALFSEYSKTMADLERTYPDVTFLYVTTPVTTQPSLKASIKAKFGRGDQSGPADNAAREQFNAMMRQEYGGTGRLFDLAAVESTAPDGTRITGESGGLPYYALYDGYAADPGHLNAIGSEQAATEMLRVIAANSGASQG